MNRRVLAVAACYVIWGLLPAFWKLLAEVNTFYTFANRILWTLIITAAVTALTGKWPELRATLRSGKNMRVFAGTGALISVNWLLYIWCTTHGRVLDSSLAYYMNPLLSILIGFFFFREKLTGLQWLSVALAAAGVLYPIFAEGRIPWLSLVISAAFALYGALKKKLTVSGEVGILAEMLVMSPVAVTIIAVMELGGTGAVSSGALSGWGLLLIPAIGLATWLPLELFSYGIQGTPMTVSGILMYVNPTLQMLLGVALYGEELTGAKLTTFAFVWAALIIFLISGALSRRRKNNAVETGT